jgi:glycosyltransferase involved in cell wall biosynthesis
VCINPQVLNDLTVGNYPRKIDEYLAAGKPVVATETEATGIFADTIYTAKNHQEFLDAVEKSLQENPNEKRAARVEMAMSHSWEASIGELSKIVEHYEHA